ncbi:unnamed protein product, partial [Mesorhabditis spiculigera]
MMRRHAAIHHTVDEAFLPVYGVRSCPLGGQNGDFGWFGLQSLITLLNISAIIANVFFIFVCGKAGVMPRQTRLMLCSISVCFAVNAFAGLLYNAYFFYLGHNQFPMYPEKSRSRADGLGINTAKYSLSKRFQIHETFRTTQMLLPSVVLHAILYLSYLLLLFPVRDWRASANITVASYNYSTIIFAFPSMHALAHPLICIFSHYYLRQRALDIFDRICCFTGMFTYRSNDDCRHLQPTPDPPSIRERETPGRVEFRIAPEKHAEILESFWDRK